MKPFEEMTKEELVKALSDSVVTVGQWMDAVQRVRELHKPFTEFDQVWCSHCIQDTLEEDLNRLHYPCPTIRTLDGE